MYLMINATNGTSGINVKPLIKYINGMKKDMRPRKKKMLFVI